MEIIIGGPEDIERQAVDYSMKTYPAIIAKAADNIMVRAYARSAWASHLQWSIRYESDHLGEMNEDMSDAAAGWRNRAWRQCEARAR